ncbi:MAG: hypothetical protein M3Y76_04380, partial [Chloroflexota bacterium]|nr:hypothetical protein [Chloroflexota bacterium]
EHYSQVSEMPTEFSVPPPPPESSYSQSAQPTPPPPGSMYSQPQQAPSNPVPNTYYPQQQGYQATPGPTPAYAKPVKDSSKSVLGQMGCGVLLVILLIVGICGGVGFFVYRYAISAASSTTSSYTSTTNGTGGNRTPQAIPTTTTQINSTVTYDSSDVTVVNVQKASSFSDDNTTSSSPYVVRLNIKEHNPTTNDVYLFYNDNFHLILPDGSSVAATSEHNSGSLGQAVTRNNWVDFPVSMNVDVSKLTLRIGGANEAQMDVPLTGSADVSKYQPKTITPNSAFTYAGLNWTVTSVTSSLSANGKQADSGMRYIVVTLKANNPTKSDYYIFASDNIRLQTGTTTSPPTDNTLSSAIPAGTSGATGTVTFLMSQSASSFTLVMLPRTDVTPAATQATSNFQI